MHVSIVVCAHESHDTGPSSYEGGAGGGSRRFLCSIVHRRLNSTTQHSVHRQKCGSNELSPPLMLWQSPCMS